MLGTMAEKDDLLNYRVTVIHGQANVVDWTVRSRKKARVCLLGWKSAAIQLSE